MNPFAWTVDNLNQPGFSAALLSMSDMAELPSHVYDMGKEPKVDLPEAETFDPRFRGMESAKRHKEAIAESWKDADVAAARITRDGVRCTVDGKSSEYRSVRTAFAKHGLPDAKHIRFRMQLKASRSETFVWEGIAYHFELVTCDATPTSH